MSDDPSLEGETEMRSDMLSQAKNKDDSFEPFNRTPKYPHEVKIYFGVLATLLISAHLEYISVWWVFVWSIGIMVPEEIKKIHTHGLEAYLEKLHFKRVTMKDVGLVIGGLVLVFLVLSLLVVGVVQVDAALSDSTSSVLQSTDGEAESGHLLATATINWWIYGLAVIAMFTIIGPAEELIFRHQLKNEFQKRTSSLKSITLTNIIFSLMHLPIIIFVPDILLMVLPLIAIFLLGMVFSLQYEFTENLFVPSITHSIYNSLVLTALLFGIA